MIQNLQVEFSETMAYWLHLFKKVLVIVYFYQVSESSLKTQVGSSLLTPVACVQVITQWEENEIYFKWVWEAKKVQVEPHNGF